MAEQRPDGDELGASAESGNEESPPLDPDNPSKEDGGLEESLESSRTAIQEARSAVGHAVRAGQNWIQAQPLTIRVVFALIGAWIANQILSFIGENIDVVVSFIGSASSHPWIAGILGQSLSGPVPLTTKQMLISFIGLYVMDSTLRRQKIDLIIEQLEDMDSGTSARTDGGKEKAEISTSGGGALGGAITGAAIGSTFGPQGALVGGFVGLVLGDEVEMKSDPDQPRDDKGRFKER